MRKLIVAAASILLLAGCTQYYKVTDPTTGKTFYTTRVAPGGGGSVQFKDAATGSSITLQNSEVKSISEKDYKAATTPPKQ